MLSWQQLQSMMFNFCCDCGMTIARICHCTDFYDSYNYLSEHDWWKRYNLHDCALFIDLRVYPQQRYLAIDSDQESHVKAKHYSHVQLYAVSGQGNSKYVSYRQHSLHMHTARCPVARLPQSLYCRPTAVNVMLSTRLHNADSLYHGGMICTMQHFTV